VGSLQGHTNGTGIAGVIAALGAANVGAVIAHAGILEQYRYQLRQYSLPTMLHVSASVDADPARATSLAKVELYTVDTAERLEADGISIHINFRSRSTKRFRLELAHASRMIERAHKRSLPVLVMAYPRDKVEVDGKVKRMTSTDPDRIAKAARVAAEIGADLVKVPVADPVDAMADVVSGTFVPVLLAGGDVRPNEELAYMWEKAAEVGVDGVVLGRNAFTDVKRTTSAVDWAYGAFGLTVCATPRPIMGQLAGNVYANQPGSDAYIERGATSALRQASPSASATEL
jgi:DhnA family fructose-bisphosphate aldolase class Ia